MTKHKLVIIHYLLFDIIHYLLFDIKLICNYTRSPFAKESINTYHIANQCVRNIFLVVL
ncbi:hypothetical protein SAMN05428978_100627 [Nitrosomonas sp. Nm34]|nr:hypothetical protein SAMN05428978_100627 [Nitrosomonas sp. Nm34]